MQQHESQMHNKYRHLQCAVYTLHQMLSVSKRAVVKTAKTLQRCPSLNCKQRYKV